MTLVVVVTFILNSLKWSPVESCFIVTPPSWNPSALFNSFQHPLHYLCVCQQIACLVSVRSQWSGTEQIQLLSALFSLTGTCLEPFFRASRWAEFCMHEPEHTHISSGLIGLQACVCDGMLSVVRVEGKAILHPGYRGYRHHGQSSYKVYFIGRNYPEA